MLLSSGRLVSDTSPVVVVLAAPKCAPSSKSYSSCQFSVLAHVHIGQAVPNRQNTRIPPGGGLVGALIHLVLFFGAMSTRHEFIALSNGWKLPRPHRQEPALRTRFPPSTGCVCQFVWRHKNAALNIIF